jgi:SAM-dependent methyltransferase
MERKKGLERLTTESMLSKSNQHYIVTYFIVNDVKESVREFARGRLLDIGCGNKPYENLIMPSVDNYIGCDVVQSSLNVVDVICPANQLSFESDSFDTVFSTQVIEHVADHQGMIRESFRVLKPGGHAIFTAPFCWELHEEPYDFFRFSKYGLKEIFEKNGFEIVTIKPNGGKWAAIMQLWLNVLYSTRKYKTIRSRIIKLLFVRLKFIVLYNKISIWLDKKYFDEGLTLNYLVVVKK